MSTKNSLTTLIHDLIKTQKNSLEIINKLSDVVSSKSDTVEIEVLDENNVIKKVVIPSFGKLQSQIERIETNVEGLAGLGDADSVLQLADGSFRKVLKDSLQKEAEDITSINVPAAFKSKSNWFFESFLNPLLFVSFDFGTQIKPNTERVEVARFILNLDTEQKQEFFNNEVLGKSDIVYDEFLDLLLEENIKFYLDQDVIKLPPRELRYFGNFSVLRVLDNPVTNVVNGEDVVSRDLRFKLDKLTYSDRDSKYNDTQQIKLGDSLVVNTDDRNTRYSVKEIDEGTSTIAVELLEGFDKVSVGVENLMFFGDDNAASIVEVNVGFNEKTVLFIKSIDPDSEIKATNWSPGVSYYSNELVITDENGEQKVLENYYKDEVVDFGAFLFSMAKEGVPPSILAEVPYTPILNVDNFKTVQINKHVTDTPVISEIKKLHAEKVKLKNEISQYSSAISTKQSQLANKKYKSKVSRDTDRNELNTLIEERTSRSKLYSSAVRDINTKAIDSGVESVSPKYRVRGFWPIPKAKHSSQTNPQEVIQFGIQYRYVTKDGGANQSEQLEFTDNDGSTRRGSFTTWVDVKTPVRQRVIDAETGAVSWIVEENENSDSNNINQLDIPIHAGEGIEFRIKSVSEAGYPSNPAESVYTDIIKVDFPEELESQVSIDSIIEEATKEGIRISLQTELEEQGIYRHVQESTESDGRYFAHSSLELASGYVDEQQTPISLFEKLKSIDGELQSLRDLIERTKGKLRVRIIDESGNTYSIENNSKLRLDAPNYKDGVESLSIKKGVIITKTYFLTIENERASELELYSKIYGPVNRRPNPSWDPTGSGNESLQGNYKYNSADGEYNTELRYDQVPVMSDRNEITNPFSGATNPFASIFNPIPYQSTQTLGQFINFRYSSIDGTETVYSDILDGTPYALNSDGSNSGGAASSVDHLEHKYSGGMETAGVSPAANYSPDFVVFPKDATDNDKNEVIHLKDVQSLVGSYDDSLYVHYAHPQISKSGGPYNFAWDGSAYNGATLLTSLYGLILNSKLAKLDNTSLYGNKQTPYFYDSAIGRGIKQGFDTNDQFLLGGYSCGSYFFPKVSSQELLRVSGNSLKSAKKIDGGSSRAISIPLVFQYRMTDYFGAGDTGIGLVGGKFAAPIDQLIYNKTLGIDIFHSIDNKFSFDITVTAKYKSNTIDITDTPQRSFQNAIDALKDSLTTTGFGSEPNIS